MEDNLDKNIEIEKALKEFKSEKNISFQENPAKKGSKMASLVMKIFKGVKNERQAEIILLIFAVIVILITIIIYFSSREKIQTVKEDIQTKVQFLP